MTNPHNDGVVGVCCRARAGGPVEAAPCGGLVHLPVAPVGGREGGGQS